MQTIIKHVYKKHGNLEDNEIFISILDILEDICYIFMVVEEYYYKIIKIYVANDNEQSDKPIMYVYYTEVLDNDKVNGYIVRFENFDELETLLFDLYSSDVKDVKNIIKRIRDLLP